MRDVFLGLLLVFGLGCLRKAILRASGFKALHDEDAIYAGELAAAQPPARRSAPWWGLVRLCAGVHGSVSRGLEVAFIVITFGSNQGSIPLAVLGAVLAIVLVVLAGVAVRGPLAGVPENTPKLVVGVLLTSFGAFWGTEGAGASWPGAQAALLGVIAVMLAVALTLTGWLRRLRARDLSALATTPRPAEVA